MPLSFLLNQPSLQDSSSQLIELLNACPEYSLSQDNSMVRLAIPVERRTVILRDIPEQATEEDVARLVQDPTVTIKKEVANSWFLQYPNEEKAMKAISVLQTSSLLGEPVKARMKSEFYKKELMKQVNACQVPRKLSSAASPFTPEGGFTSWGSIGLPNGLE